MQRFVCIKWYMWCWNQCLVGSAVSFQFDFSSNLKKSNEKSMKSKPHLGSQAPPEGEAHPQGWRDKHTHTYLAVYLCMLFLFLSTLHCEKIHCFRTNFSVILCWFASIIHIHDIHNAVSTSTFIHWSHKACDI